MNWWRHVVAMELRKILAYRSDFWVTFLGQTFIQLLVARALWQSIYASQGVTEMKGYTLEMMNFYYLIVPIGMRILTGANIGFVAREIYDGTFTRYLLYPLSVFQYKALTYLTHSFFYATQLILIYTIYRVFISTAPFGFNDLANLGLGVLLFFIASMAYGMMAFLIELLALWADNIWSLAVMMKFFISFFGGAFIPLSFLPGWSLKIIAWTPFPYLVSLPARTVMGLSTSTELIQGSLILFVWILVFREFSKLLWKVGQHRYTGVGI
jgi:ABC-2 type transport system permease protein